MHTKDQFDVIIIGGGIGGLSAAFALQRKGLHVRVVERHEFGEVGAGLQIAPNCTRILDEYGLLEEAKLLGVVPESMVMKDAMDGTELTRLDLKDLERKYGFPYMVIHRSDLHGLFLRACERAGVDLETNQQVVAYENVEDGAKATFADGHTEQARLIIAADGLHSVAREQFVGDDPVSSAYVAYRAAVPIDSVQGNDVSEKDVVLYVGPARHFVQYPLRGGDMFNQVAVFQSLKALAGEEDWGTPDEMEAAFEGSCEQVLTGLPLMWRDRWWRMYDRDPVMNWVYGRIILLGDSAHPPLQYMAQGAIMAIEDGWVLAEHVGKQLGAGTDVAAIDWEDAVQHYNAVRPEHCRRVLTTGRAWGELWHVDGLQRLQRNKLLRDRDTYDYTYTEWIYGPTALYPEDEPEMYPIVPLDSVEIDAESQSVQG